MLCFHVGKLISFFFKLSCKRTGAIFGDMSYKVSFFEGKLKYVANMETAISAVGSWGR